MLVALILISIGVLLMLFCLGREPVPWETQLRRVQAGVARKAEWVASDTVVDRVRRDYLEAVDWLMHAAEGIQLDAAPSFLMGRFLARFQTIVNHSKYEKRISIDGLFRAQHHVQVRQFSDDGSRCLVIDCQTERQIESRYAGQPTWALVQDMDDRAVVFQMCYDVTVKRWKIEALVQELPSSWCDTADVRPVDFCTQMPTTIGRDF